MNCIVIAGIKRSGSTALYNMVRLVLEDAEYDVRIHGQDYEPRYQKSTKVDLVKIHPFRQKIAEFADHIFVTDRCDSGILQSLDRMWDSGNKKRLSGMRGDLAKWMLWTTPDYYFHFDDLSTDWIERVADLMNLYVDIEKVRREFNAIQPPKDKQDPVTLLFPNHISDDYS